MQLHDIDDYPDARTAVSAGLWAWCGVSLTVTLLACAAVAWAF